jgi:DNA-binding MarR family transcriptional regulator
VFRETSASRPAHAQEVELGCEETPRKYIQSLAMLVITIIVMYSQGMVEGLAREIKQTRSFTSLEGEAGLNILRTSELLYDRLNTELKKLDLTFTQYNVLRILRGAGSEGVSCSQLAERMIVRDPDVTRLLDRIEKRGYVVRRRSEQDRRILMVTISPAGMKQLQAADRPVREVMESSLRKLGKEVLSQLIQNLEAVRA